MVSDESAAHISNKFLLLVALPDGGEKRYPLESREVTVGRDPSNDIQLSHHFVSQFHAKLVRTGSSLSIVDLGSANKTWVNGREILRKALKEGDQIDFADVKCRLVANDYPNASQPDTHEKNLEVRRPDSPPLEPPISKIYLSIGVVLLFSAVVALATQVC